MKPSSLTQRSSSPTAVLRRHARRLRQLAHADEVLRIERADAMDQIVADLRPFEADALVADMMPHAGGTRREDRQIGAALALQLELVLLDAFADLVVGHFQRGARRHCRLVLGVGGRGLLLAEAMEVFGLGRVVAVAIDDHDKFADLEFEGRDATAAVAAIVKLGCRSIIGCALAVPGEKGMAELPRLNGIIRALEAGQHALTCFRRPRSPAPWR